MSFKISSPQFWCFPGGASGKEPTWQYRRHEVQAPSLGWEHPLDANSVGEESSYNVRDHGLIPGLGRFPKEGIDYPLQYSQASLVAQLAKNPLQCGRLGFSPWVGKVPWRRQQLLTPVFWPQRVGHDWATFTNMSYRLSYMKSPAFEYFFLQTKNFIWINLILPSLCLACSILPFSLMVAFC